MGSELFDEAATWKAARSGHSASFGLIFDVHRDRVFGHALRLMRSPHEAEDVTAVVFLEAWRRRDTVRVVEGSIIGWLLVTANYVARNASRTSRRYDELLRRLPAPETTADHADEVGARVEGERRAVQVREAFAHLTKKDQDVIALCVLEELSVGQAAQTLGIPPGTVKSRLSRAKQRLATHVGVVPGEQTILEGGAL